MKCLSLKSLLKLIFGSLLLSACLPAVSADLGEQFSLNQGASARIRGHAVRIKLLLVDARWVDGDEIPYADLKVSVQGKSQEISLNIGGDAQISDYLLELKAANPFDWPGTIELLVSQP